MKRHCGRHEYEGAVPGCAACENILRAYHDYDLKRMGQPVETLQPKPRSRLSVIGGVVGDGWILFCRGIAVMLALPFTSFRALVKTQSSGTIALVCVALMFVGMMIGAGISEETKVAEQAKEDPDPMKAPGCHFLESHYNGAMEIYVSEVHVYGSNEQERKVAEFDRPERAMQFLKDNNLKFCEQVP